MKPRRPKLGRSLAERFPDRAKMWCYELNYPYTPWDVGATVKFEAWWECDQCDHVWQVSVNTMTAGAGCPVCSGQALQVGVNDFASLHPDRARNWHPTKNGSDNPSDFKPGSHYSAAWLCPDCGYEWQSRIEAAVDAVHACPGCAGRAVVPGVNDMGTLYPDISAQWHPTKNGDKLPAHYRPGSNDKAWWLCDVCGDSWDAVIASRCLNGRGCRTCAGYQVKIGFNDLGTRRPDVAAQWHPTKNGDNKPEHFTVSSSYTAWWYCTECESSWQATIDHRTSGYGCSVCAGQKVKPGFNDLGSQDPEHAAEFHPTKNGDLRPEHFTVASGKRVWWKCKDCSHAWVAAISTRTCHGRGCPACSGRVVTPGINDFASQQPQLVPEWDTENNADAPSEVHQFSTKRAHWVCQVCGHKWSAQIYGRSEGNGCPACAGAAASKIEGRMRDLLGNCDTFNSDLGGTDVLLSVPSQRRGFMRVDALVVTLETQQKLVVEYDGSWWHSSAESIRFDTRKTLRMLANGYKVVRIRERALEPLPIRNTHLLQIPYKWHHQDHTLQDVINQIEEWA